MCAPMALIFMVHTCWNDTKLQPRHCDTVIRCQLLTPIASGVALLRVEMEKGKEPGIVEM